MSHTLPLKVDFLAGNISLTYWGKGARGPVFVLFCNIPMR